MCVFWHGEVRAKVFWFFFFTLFQIPTYHFITGTVFTFTVLCLYLFTVCCVWPIHHHKIVQCNIIIIIIFIILGSTLYIIPINNNYKYPDPNHT